MGVLGWCAVAFVAAVFLAAALGPLLLEWLKKEEQKDAQGRDSR
jgi:hypothetical protein